MKKTKAELLKYFNEKDNLFLISEYNADLKNNVATGLSNYSKNTINSFQENPIGIGRVNKVIIIAQILKKEEIYEENQKLIIRCFKRDDPLSYFRLIYYLRKLNRVKNVLFEFEFASYGGKTTTAIIPFLLLIFKFLGKRSFFVMHQAVKDLKALHRHLGLSKKSLELSFFQLSLNIFYFSIGVLANKIIVLEERFKRILLPFISEKKIEVIPHGIEEINPQKTQAFYRKILGFNKNDFVILCFGYVAWYKGVDRLIRTFNNIPSTIEGKRINLIIAGGKSIAQKGKNHYERFFNKINSLAKHNRRTILTGFVPNDEIEKYYQASDLCILPYYRFISSSGPLSLSVSYKKPILLSKELLPYLETNDFESAFNESGLKVDQMFIDMEEGNLKDFIKMVMLDRKYKLKMKGFEQKLLTSRSWKKLGKKYNNLITEEITSKQSTRNIRFIPNFNFEEKQY